MIVEAMMQGAEVKRIREEIGRALGRRVSQRDLGLALGLAPKNADDTARSWEDGSKPVSGPAALALELLLYCIQQGHIAQVEHIMTRGSARD